MIYMIYIINGILFVEVDSSSDCIGFVSYPCGLNNSNNS